MYYCIWEWRNFTPHKHSSFGFHTRFLWIHINDTHINSRYSVIIPSTCHTNRSLNHWIHIPIICQTHAHPRAFWTVSMNFWPLKYSKTLPPPGTIPISSRCVCSKIHLFHEVSTHFEKYLSNLDLLPNFKVNINMPQTTTWLWSLVLKVGICKKDAAVICFFASLENLRSPPQKRFQTIV